jgi:hypothetical protein
MEVQTIGWTDVPEKGSRNHVRSWKDPEMVIKKILDSKDPGRVNKKRTGEARLG